MIDIAVIVVSYRSSRDLPALIASLDQAAQGADWRLVVVDNAGESLANKLPPHERVTIVDAGGNLGYSGGINVGLAHAPRARWLVFLNPDLVLQPESLARLIDVDPDVAATVPKIVDEHGERQNSLRREPTLSRALGDALFGDRWAHRPDMLAETVRGDRAYQHPRSVDWATGAALAVRGDAVTAVGRWDERRFFMYSEETDYGRRIRLHAGEIRYLPEAVVMHRAGGSGSSPALDALLEVNKVRYYAKWHGRVATAAFGVVTLARNAARPHRAGSRLAVRALVSARARATLPGGDR